jgi:hypothetical protein
MQVTVLMTFLQDIADLDDRRFLPKILSDVLSKDGSFKTDRADHRFKGIEGGWIRHLTGGRSAFRVVYLRRNDSVFLYRVGQHSVEDGLTEPKSLDGVVVGGKEVAVEGRTGHEGRAPWIYEGRLLYTQKPTMISKLMHSMSFVAHKEIIFVSPFVTEELLERNALFGRFLDRMIEDGADVWLVTKPPDESKIAFYRSLEVRGFGIYFYENLHTKLYLFDIDEEKLTDHTKDIRSTGVVGSANLTEMGLALQNALSNEELCFQIPLSKFNEARDYAFWLMDRADDVAKYSLRLTRRF